MDSDLSAQQTAILRLNYEIIGSGSKRIVLLPGIGQSKDTYNRLIQYFRSNHEYCLLILDLPGSPGSKLKFTELRQYRCHHSIGFAYVICSALRELNWLNEKHKVHFCSFDLSAVVTLQIALLSPHCIASMTLVSSFIDGDGLGPQARTIARTLMAAATPFKRIRINSWLRAFYPNEYLHNRANDATEQINKEVLVQQFSSRQCVTRVSRLGLIFQSLALLRHRLTVPELNMIRDTVQNIQIICGPKTPLHLPPGLTSCVISLGADYSV